METIFLSLNKSEFQDLIAETVNACLRRLPPQTNQQASDQWFNLTELCNYLPDKPARQTVYGYVSANTIPYHKTPGQRKLKFLKSDIDAWLKSGRNKTEKDFAGEADDFLSTHKRKRQLA